MRALLYKLNPAVPQHWLLLFAGVLWTCVGVFLCIRAFGWTVNLPEFSGRLSLASGAAVAFAWNRFMFANIARKNVSRIIRLPQRACVFGFTGWRGYAMILAMSVLGILLRDSLIPKQLLAALYSAMGGALILASVIFYRSFWTTRIRAPQ